MLQIITLPVGSLQANCYLMIDLDSKQTLIIDPGDDAEKIHEVIRDFVLKPVMIVNTHGHGDHIGANGEMKRRYEIPIAIHEDDAVMLTSAEANLSLFLGLNILSPPADIFYKDGDVQDFADNKIQILHTPGHSPGGISLYIDGNAITGDALFRHSIGRTDFPGASHEQLIQGIQEKLFTLPEETKVYPGHGPSTTIGEEKRNNPFLSGKMG